MVDRDSKTYLIFVIFSLEHDTKLSRFTSETIPKLNLLYFSVDDEYLMYMGEKLVSLLRFDKGAVTEISK